MKHISAVKEIRPNRYHWKAVIAGTEKEWDAEVTEQTPNQAIAWRGLDSENTSGSVQFTELGPSQTNIALKMTYQPETTKERLGDALGLVTSRVEADLAQFKEHMEKRSRPTAV
jgi:uncharacterized membrane protein